MTEEVMMEQLEEDDAGVSLAIAIPTSAEALKEVEEAVRDADKRYRVAMAQVAYAISKTSSADWVDMQGKPHPQNRAVMMMIAMAGIRISPPQVETIRRDDGHYIKRATGTAQRVGYEPVGAVGKAYSNDPFFTTRYAENENGDRERITLPASEVAEDDVEGKAVTNFYYRALCAVLGLKGLTWDDLRQLGIEKKKAAARITFGEGKALPKGEPSGKQGTSGGAFKCPACGVGVMRERKGKNGTFYGCSKYPDCRHTMQNLPDENAPQSEPPPASGSGGAGTAGGMEKMELLNQLLAYAKEHKNLSPSGLWADMSAYLGRQVKTPADISFDELVQYSDHLHG